MHRQCTVCDLCGLAMCHLLCAQATYWESALPDLIEAVMCINECEQARSIHWGYLAAYGRTAAQVPLLHYNGHGFTDISG